MEWTFLGDLDFCAAIGNAIDDARASLELQSGPHIGPVGKGDFRLASQSVSQLSWKTGEGWGTTYRERLATSLWNCSGFEFPQISELRARAA